MNQIIEYRKYPSGYEKVESVNGFSITSDKHAYACKVCGAIYQSKNIECRSLFPTDDPRCKVCNHTSEDLERVCKCEPVIQ